MTEKDTSFQFPQLMALLKGTEEPSLALGFIDLCGTTAYVGHFIASNGGSQGALTRLMTSFGSALANVAKEDPALKVVQASDGAFLVGEPDSVLEGIIKTMMYAPFFYFDPKNMGFIPMRAAISHGLVRVEVNKTEISKISNLYSLPYWGPAFVKVHLMEKTKLQKGIRVFGTDSVIAKMRPEYQKVFDMAKEVDKVSVSAQGEEKFFQANWLALVPQLTDVVLAHFGIDPSEDEYGIKNLAKIVSVAQDWKKSADQYDQMYADSILELKEALEKHLP